MLKITQKGCFLISLIKLLPIPSSSSSSLEVCLNKKVIKKAIIKSLVKKIIEKKADVINNSHVNIKVPNRNQGARHRATGIKIK